MIRFNKRKRRLVRGDFLIRGEWEHVGFSDVKDITVGLNNFRVGIGYQF